MKVILKDTGEIKAVADGYARNYLLPRDLAIAATKEAIKLTEELRAQQAVSREKQHQELLTVSDKLKGAKVDIAGKANEEGTLFASIDKAAISKTLSDQFSVTLEATDIVLADPIKAIGEHSVGVRIASIDDTVVTINVTAE